MTTRRLAAILAADVVGFSKLIGEDEAGTLAALREIRKGIVNPLMAKHGGRVFKLMGDGLLAEFPSAVQALEAAMGIQQRLRERNAEANCKKPVHVRIGIHQGDVVVEGSDLLGDGVNIAARLEALAEPGGICISGRVDEDVTGKITLEAQDMGEQNLKNIARPVRAYRVALVPSSRGDEHVAQPALPLPDKPSIAVLPFRNMSGDPEQEYFVDGMVDDIITGLSRIKWLFVIARNSTFTYKGRAVDVKRVGRELGVRYVLEGSVRKLADRVRITGQLVDAGSGAHVWAERYDRKAEDVFALQDEIALAVVGAIEPNLLRAEVERVKRKRPDSLDAYDLVLRAQPDVYSGMPDRARTALPLLERALELNSGYALAHAFAAMCHHNLFLRAGLREEERVASIRYAHMAMMHGQDDALALTFAGFSIGMDGHDRTAAFTAFEAALALSPSSALTYIFGSVILGWTGEAERAIEWGERGLRLSPFDPWAFAAFGSLMLASFQRGRYDDALKAAHKAVQSNPAHSINHVMLAGALAKLGRLEEARSAASKALELQPSFQCKRQLAGVDCPPSLAVPPLEALVAAGLPE
jgi:adenylate cyclase